MPFLTTVNRYAAQVGMAVCIAGLFAIVAVVGLQVFGRYVLNDSPTWAENLALVLILYVTLIGAAIGVRDAGHLGFDLLIEMVPSGPRRWFQVIIQALVALFGIAMIYNGWVLGESVAGYKMPNLHLSEAVRYVPLVISGILIVTFSIEQIVSTISDKRVESP